jgi:hypothetical protein
VLKVRCSAPGCDRMAEVTIPDGEGEQRPVCYLHDDTDES